MPVDDSDSIPDQQSPQREDSAPSLEERQRQPRDSEQGRRGLSHKIRDPGPTVEDLDRQLRMLMILRVGAASAVLVATLYIQFLAGSQFSLRPLFGVTGLVYTFSILFALLHRWGIHWPPYVAIQLSVDVLLESLIVYFIGGFG